MAQPSTMILHNPNFANNKPMAAFFIFYLLLLPVPIKTKQNTTPLLSTKVGCVYEAANSKAFTNELLTVYQNATKEKTAANNSN